jgi:hypothetical protein
VWIFKVVEVLWSLEIWPNLFICKWIAWSIVGLQSSPHSEVIGKKSNQNQTQECVRYPQRRVSRNQGLLSKASALFRKAPLSKDFTWHKAWPLIERCQQPRFATPCSGGLFSLCAGLCLNAPSEWVEDSPNVKPSVGAEGPTVEGSDCKNFSTLYGHSKHTSKLLWGLYSDEMVKLVGLGGSQVSWIIVASSEWLIHNTHICTLNPLTFTHNDQVQHS